MLTLTPDWKADPPVLAVTEVDGRFLVDAGERVRAFTPEGTVVWESETVADGYRVWMDGHGDGRAVAADDSGVYVGTVGSEAGNARLYGFDRADGSVRWVDETAATGDRTGVEFATLVGDLVVYGADSDGSSDDQDPVVRAVDRASGEVAWVDESIDGQFVVGATAYDGRLFVAGTTEVFVYDGASGAVIDSFGADPASDRSLRPGFVGVARAGSRLYGFDRWDEAIKAIDLDAFAVEWATTTRWEPNTPLAVDGGVASFGTESGYLVAFDLDGREKRWEARVEGAVGEPLVPDGERLWASDSTGTVYAVSIADGSVIAETSLSEERVGLAVLDGRLLNDGDQWAYAIEAA